MLCKILFSQDFVQLWLSFQKHSYLTITAYTIQAGALPCVDCEGGSKGGFRVLFPLTSKAFALWRPLQLHQWLFLFLAVCPLRQVQLPYPCFVHRQESHPHQSPHKACITDKSTNSTSTAFVKLHNT